MAFGVALSWMWTWGDFLWAQEPVYDIVIRGGRIVDGTGNPWFKGDVGIQGGRITAVGSISNGARRVIDAEGLVVAPGFIDLHTHSDLPLLRNGNAENKIRQGAHPFGPAPFAQWKRREQDQTRCDSRRVGGGG